MVVYGAFGSGKSYCLAEAVRCLARNKNKKILICTSCDSAADIYFEIWDREIKSRAIKLVRHINSKQSENLGCQTVCCVPLSKEVIKKISDASIVVCTFYTSILLNEDPKIAEWFTHILIDEAAQALECETIMPLTLALSNTTVVLAGDHRQIGPSIYSHENYTFFGSNLSLLQRLFAYYTFFEHKLNNTINMFEFKLMLTTIHRTVGQIVDFISNNFYNSTLKSRRKSIELIDKSLNYYPIQFVDYDNCSEAIESYDSKYCSYNNRVEAECICWFIEMLINNWPIEWDNISIGIVCSEIAQVEIINNICSANVNLKKYKILKQIKCDLVQNFQGWQFRVIIISTVRTQILNNKHDNLLYSLLINPYSINTCLTRTEELLIVFGNRNFLSNVPELYLPYHMSDMWKNLISLCIDNKSYYKMADCVAKNETKFYFKQFKTQMDFMNYEAKKPNENGKASKSSADKNNNNDEYKYKQKINDIILNNISENIGEDNNDEINSYEDDLPISRRLDRQMVNVIPFKRNEATNDYDEMKNRRRRKLYSQYDAIDSDNGDNDEDENEYSLDDNIEIEELENYMCMKDEDDLSDETDGNGFNNNDSKTVFKFIKPGKMPYYETISRKCAQQLLNENQDKYKLCKLRFENNSFTAVARSINDEDESYYIRDRCNCGMAYDGDTVVVELLDLKEVDKSAFNSKQKRARVVCVWQRNEKFRNREFVCLPDEYEPCLMLKPLDSTYPKIFIHGTRDSRRNNKITIYKVDDDNQIKTSKYHAIDLSDLNLNMYVVRIVHWNSYFKYPIGIVTEVLDSATTVESALRCLTLQYRIDTEEPACDLFEKQNIDLNGLNKQIKYEVAHKERLDLTNVLTFTIDPEQSKDFDDAISIEVIDDNDKFNGYYIIGIHIADVSEYVIKGSELDKEAEKRITSYYYNLKNEQEHIPMLPRELCTNLCSLKPNIERLCLSVIFIMNSNGEIVESNGYLDVNYDNKYLITKTVIKSDYRFTYKQVEMYLNNVETHNISNELRILHDLSIKLKMQRYKNGFLFIEESSFETLDFDDELNAFQAHSLIEEFMIITNKIIADYLCANYDYVPLRVQKIPEMSLLKDWFLKNKSFETISFGVERYIACISSFVDIKTFEENNQLNVNSKVLPNNLTILKPIFEKILEICKEFIQNKSNNKTVLLKKLQYLICNENNYPLIANAIDEIRSIMESAEYLCVYTKTRAKSQNIRHFSVNLFNYTHFTSPIRRYIDLIVHRMVKAALKKDNQSDYPYTKIYLKELCQTCTVKASNQRKFEKRIKLITIAEQLKQTPIQCISYVNSIEDRQISVSYPYFNNIKLNKCSKIPYSCLDPSRQPLVKTNNFNSKPKFELNESGETIQVYEAVDLEFSKRIYDIDTKHEILELIDHTEDKTIVKINLNKLYISHINIEHWTQTRSLLKNNTNKSLQKMAMYLGENIFNQNELKEHATYLDVSSEVIGKKLKQQIIETVLNNQSSDQQQQQQLIKKIKHFNRRFMKNYKCGDVVKTQLTYNIEKGFLSPAIQLVSITNTIDFCVQHRTDPVKCFSRKAKEPIKAITRSYSDFQEYLRIWLPILSMEAATNAILEPEDVAFIRNCKIEWNKEEACDPITKQYSEVLFGKLKLNKNYCDERHLKFAEESENELVSGVQSIPRGHPTFALSYLCIQYKNIPYKEPQKRLFSNKTGNLLLKHHHTWVAHCVVTKVIDEKVESSKILKRKPSQDEETNFSYIIHLALMQSDSEIPQVLLEKYDLKECTIELISKQYTDSAMEYAIRKLNEPKCVITNLSTSIILGNPIPPLDPKAVLDEKLIENFIKTCIKSSGGKLQNPNVKQDAAIKNAFRQNFSLIQGPPGTVFKHACKCV